MQLFRNNKTNIHGLAPESGISLVEMLVALAILGVSASAFITALSTGAISVRMQDEMTISQGLAQSEMEVIQSAAYDATGSTYPVLSGPPGYTLVVQTDSTIYGDNRIQQVIIMVKHDNVIVFNFENYKVNR